MCREKLNCVLIIDDNDSDNFFHRRAIQKTGLVKKVIVKESSLEALAYLKAPEVIPDLIFLDVKMPVMNGWEFLLEYKNIQSEWPQKIILFTSVDNPELREKTGNLNMVDGICSKPLTQAIFSDIIEQYF